MTGGHPRFLVIRRDNIGDLVCTTPLIAALRQRFPTAEICALVNSYNAPVLDFNPDLDAVFAYTKGKHREAGESLAGNLLRRLALFLSLRRKRFDYAILAAPGFVPRALRLARMASPRHILGFVEEGNKRAAAIDLAVPYGNPGPLHEAEDVFRLLAPLGIDGPPPAARVFPSPDQPASAARATPLVAVHISARKPSQRWPAERFAALMRALHGRYNAHFMLFWSPGDEHNPLHPGDDAKARAIMAEVADLPVQACPTRRLRELIDGLARCDCMICSDGGAMHLGAGLGKPILCFFGASGVTRWRPWKVPQVVLQKETMEVMDISVEEALEGFTRLDALRRNGETTE